MKTEISITQVRADAEASFKSGEFLCAEAVVHSIRQNIAPNMPKELISAASGFPIGVGRSQCMCGTVSAGVLCLGYFFGRDFPTTITDPYSQKTIVLSFELQESFKTKHGALCCHIHTKDMDMKSNEYVEKCSVFVGDMAAKTAEIVARELGLKVAA
ncbi:MAG: C-GCAxxG-C-C family protein [Defluviitaleaceae bacterium]|nr:C-GCAxxG-C-C family protein [Defluviitaleaceae bacterium]